MLTLTSNFWDEIEALNMSTLDKTTLKGLVHAYSSKTIPATVNEREINSIRDANIGKIKLEGTEKEECLMIMHFVPENSVKHREFLYLAKCYPGGTSSQISQHKL